MANSMLLLSVPGVHKVIVNFQDCKVPSKQAVAGSSPVSALLFQVGTAKHLIAKYDLTRLSSKRRLIYNPLRRIK